MNKQDQLILDEALARWQIGEDELNASRLLMEQDIKFAIGNSDNQYQWDNAVLAERAGRPSYTVNKLPQFIKQVVNDARANSGQIKIRPVDSGADKDSAEIYQGLIKNIENVSNADIAYDTAIEHAATCGLGYFRLVADYADYKSFNQDLIIKRVADPLSVRLDPFFTNFDGSDSKYGFVESIISKKDFEATYPDAEGEWQDTSGGWTSSDSVRICEYMRIVDKPMNLQLLSDGSSIYEGEAIPDGLEVLKQRKGKKCVVEWYKITNSHILERSIIQCSYIPIFPVIGNETYVDGKAVRSGMVRNAKDTVRIGNSAISSEIELISNAPKAPWLGFEGQFTDPKWADANIKNHAYLEAKSTDLDGNSVPLPQRNQFSGVPSGLVQVIQQSDQNLREVIGMYNASLGGNSAETSGRAILAKQKEGDTGTYHYNDNLSRAKTHLAKCLLEMIRYYYDVQRIARTLGEDGTTNEVMIDPNGQQALAKKQNSMGKFQKIFNPNIGKYDVVVTVGPSYASQRMETAETLLELARVIPMIAQVAPDLIARALDAKGVDEIADRLKSTLPPGLAKEDDDDQEPLPPQAQQAVQQAQQAMQAVQMKEQELQQAAQELQAKDAELVATQAKIENAMAKLQAQTSVFNSNQQIAQLKQANDESQLKAMLDNAKTENDMATKDQQIQQMEAYTKQLEDMVEQLSDAVEESANEPIQEKEQAEPVEKDNPQLTKSIEMIAGVVEQIAKPKRKTSKATKNADGSYTIETIEQ